MTDSTVSGLYFPFLCGLTAHVELQFGEICNKNSSGDEIANVELLRSAPGSYPNSLK